MVEPVVLVLPARRDQPLQRLPQVVDATGLVLHRGDRRGRAADEGDRLALGDARPLDRALNLGGDVDRIHVTPGPEAQLRRMDIHAAKLAQLDR
jgi:hypothetical protein